MYQTCYATACPGLCCNYYAECTYRSISNICYSSITYYYYDYWWVYTLAGVLFLIAVLSAVLVARRRRMNRMRRAQDTIIVNDSTNPSYTMGEPVYHKQTEMAALPNQGTNGQYNYVQNGYLNPAYNQGGYSQGAYNQGGYNQSNQAGYNQNYGNGNMLGGNVQGVGYGLANDLVSNQQ